ncbi:ATP-binding protein [Mesorhizobium escarrei]|nr:winged helix-turn-helix domain-containing protein [Mesorhizobium escarrei]
MPVREAVQKGLATVADHPKGGISFGPFTLFVGERLLTKEGVPVKLGARALDILVTLTSAPNEVQSKEDLMSRVWPGVTVEEGSLRFHLASLRKALGDGKDGARFIATLPGRGYCFVASVSQAGSRGDDDKIATPSFLHANIPSRLGRMLGRDEDVLKVSVSLTASRFVTIVGPGGVGKTTVAVAVAHHLMSAFAGSVLFVDLGMVTDPKLAPTAVASMLGLSVQSDDAIPSLAAYLRDKRILLILDTCEHLIEAVAPLAASIVDAGRHVHLIATSREALRVEGEHVYRLGALAYPPNGRGLTAATVQKFPATQLFMERAVASGAPLIVSDFEAPIVADICRKLDGVALAIELAARRVESYGLQQMAALLDERLTLLWQGSRSAPPRHKTLHAALDWSYGLLSESERVVLRRLAVFIGYFTLDAALEVVTSTTLDRTAVFEAIDNLVAKSMVATHPLGAMVRYRLLDTTRAYALDIDIDDAQATDLAVRHATYYRRWLEQTGIEWTTLSAGSERTPHFAALNNVRAALEWSFGEGGDLAVAVGLATAAAPVFLAMSLLPECHRWSERAIASLSPQTRGGHQEMKLQAALGVSLMFMRGGRDAAREALERGLAIAESNGDTLDQIRLLGPLHMFHRRTGKFASALEYAKRCSAAAATVSDPAAKALAHTNLGLALHVDGRLVEARSELEASLADEFQQTTTIYLGFEGRILATAVLARNLWLQGYAVQATECAHQAVEGARDMDHSLSLAIALVWAATVYLWTGDLQSAEIDLDQVIALSEPHSMTPYVFVGRGFRGELAIRRGNTKAGIDSLQSSIQKLHTLPYELVTTELSLSLAKGFSVSHRFDEGLRTINETIKLIEANGDFLYMPEALRTKGDILLSMARDSDEDAETCFAQSLEWSRRQGALSWELRTTIDLAKLAASRGQSKEVRTLLLPVFERFTEGFDTADLKAAERLLSARA